MKKNETFTPFEDPVISPLPNLVVNINDMRCPVSMSTIAVSIPAGSRSGPLTLDFSGCEPSEKILVTAIFSPLPASSGDIYI